MPPDEFRSGTIGNMPREYAPVEHGSLRMYSNRKCRCDLCVTRWREYQREHAARPEQRTAERRRRLMRKFGITLEEYEALLEEQGGVCAICLRPEPVPDRSLSVDHDHSCCPTKFKSCGKCIRGLLCGDCNIALGKFGDDPQRLRDALRYLLS